MLSQCDSSTFPSPIGQTVDPFSPTAPAPPPLPRNGLVRIVQDRQESGEDVRVPRRGLAQLPQRPHRFLANDPVRIEQGRPGEWGGRQGAAPRPRPTAPAPPPRQVHVPVRIAQGRQQSREDVRVAGRRVAQLPQRLTAVRRTIQSASRSRRQNHSRSGVPSIYPLIWASAGSIRVRCGTAALLPFW